MSSGESAFDRFSKLVFNVAKMAMDKVRDVGQVADVLQVINDERNFHSILLPSRSASVSTEPTGGWAADWTRFYQGGFGLTGGFADIPSAEERTGLGWVVMVAKDLALNQAWAACGKLFPTYSYIGHDFDS